MKSKWILGKVDVWIRYLQRMILEKYVAKGKKYATLMDLEKVFDGVDWSALWNVVKIYILGDNCWMM